MKNKKQENQNLTESTYSDDFDDALFALAESASGEAFTEKKQRLESKHNRLTERYYDEFDPLVFKICLIILAGMIALAGIAVGIVIYYNSQLGAIIASPFLGGGIAGLAIYLLTTALRLLLFKINYNKTKKLYSRVKSFAEASIELPIKLDYSAVDIMNGYYAVGFAESDAVKSKLNKLL